jgi:hypothetical protein
VVTLMTKLTFQLGELTFQLEALLLESLDLSVFAIELLLVG